MKWPTAPLERLCPMVGGGTPSKERPEFWNGTIPWVSPKDMRDREIVDSEDHITEEAVGQSATQVVPAGSVLFVVRSGILVRRLPIAIARRPVALNQDMKALLPGGPLLPEFLAYAMEARADYILHQCVKRGATVHSVDVGKLQQAIFPVPPPSEQRRIVEILDQADALRKLRAETDAKAARILPALFIEMFGDPATNPMGWTRNPLAEVTADLRYGTSQRCHTEPDGVPVLRIPNVVRGEIDLSDLKYARLPTEEEQRLLLQRHDLLFVRTNGNPAYVGRCAVFEEPGAFAFASYLIRARLNLTRVDPWFIAAFLRTPFGRHAMAPYIRTTAGQSNINTEGLRQIPVPSPPLEDQRKFCALSDRVRKSSQLAERASAEIKKVFASLLDEGFSGDLTANWREAHMKELLQEMEHQARYLSRPGSQEASL